MNAAKTCLVLLGLVTISKFLSAQQPVSVPEAQITTTREILPAEEENRQLIVLEAKEIAKLPANSIDEILRMLPGIEVQQRGVMGVQADISARGGTFNQVLVLIDGVRMNDPLTGHFSGYFPVPLSEVARIEVIKGASSGMYGTEAVGAVIHIITKSYLAIPNDSAEGAGQVMLGTHDAVMGDAYMQLNRDAWTYGIAFSSRESAGHTPPNDSLPYDFDMQTLSGSAVHHGSKLKAGIRASLDERDFAARYFYTRSTLDLSREQVARYQAQAFAHIVHSENWRTEVHAGGMKTTDEFVFNPAFTGNFHTTRLFDANANSFFKASEKRSYTIGAQWIGRDVSSNDRGDHRFGQFGVYGSQQVVSNGWHWQTSLRFEHHDAFGWEWVPQMSLSKMWNSLKAHGFVGKSIRAADVTELYVSRGLEGPLSDGRNLGNPNLLAERSWNYEAGVAWESGTFSADVTGFWRDADQLIDFILTPEEAIPGASNLQDSASYFYAQNVAGFKTYGIDVQLKNSHQLSEDWSLGYGVGFLWVDFSEDIASKYVANSAGVLATGKVALGYKGSSLNIDVLHKQRESAEAEAISRELTESYSLVNASLQVKVYKVLSVKLNVMNLLDERYADVLGAQMAGRWVMAGLRVDI